MGGKSYDPLVIEDFDWDNEWVDSTVVHAGRDNDDLIDLTWEDVDCAVGASESLRGRNLPRQARRTTSFTYQRRARMRTQEDEEEQEDGNDSNNEDLEEDPLDDIDVTDTEEASGAENGGEDDAAPTVPDEFDDGY